MWSGSQTLSNLDQALTTLKADMNRVDNELNSITESLSRNKHSQAMTVKRMAAVRLDEIRAGTLISTLDAADHEVVDLLRQRDQARRRLEEDIQQAVSTIDALEQSRSRQQRKVAKCGEDLIAAENKVQSKLEHDAQYQAQLQRARDADSVADEAEEKASVAQQDRVDKGKPFESDPLFHYLWKRGYGTTEYRANPLARLLDGWVARLCGYNAARVNYWSLLEIPRRLNEHAEYVRRLADGAAAEVEKLDVAAAAEAGVPELQQEVRDAEARQEEIDSEIAAAEDRHNELLEKRAGFASGHDQYTQQCINLLSDAMAQDDIYELNRAVNLTRSRQDDPMVGELLELREQYEDLHKELIDGRRRHDAQMKRLTELEEVRRKFKHNRYDGVRSGFGNEQLIAAVLSQFVNGLINGADLWGTLRRHQRHRDVGAWPDFGSGGLGRRRRRGGGPWHRPGRRSGGGFRLPRNGGFSSRGRGGGFRTGGGF